MAIGIQNYPNIDTTDPVGYPEGRSKDNNGSLNGTPVKELTLGDYQQFFAKILREMDITPNGLPDNETNGHEYFQAAKELFSEYREIIVLPMVLIATTLIPSHKNPLVIYRAAAAAGNLISLVQPSGSYTGTVKFVNLNASTVGVVAQGGENVGSGVSFDVDQNEVAEFRFDGTDWIVEKFYTLV